MSQTKVKVRCVGGPRDGWSYYQEDWDKLTAAAAAMRDIQGRTADHPSSWPLGYRQQGDELRWTQ